MIKSVATGLAGAATLFAFYFLLLALLAGSWWHPIDDLLEFKYWIGTLVAGFGIQVGLFHHIRSIARLKGHGGKTVAVGTGTSTTAMIACCAHHLADVLPIIGFAGVALFLSEYKTVFMAIGILSNIGGIILMIRHIRRCQK